MDKSWLKEKRTSLAYIRGLDKFLEFSAPTLREGKMPCPCKKCVNGNRLEPLEIKYHLKSNGFMKNYDTWYRHGEECQPSHKFSECSTSRVYETRRDHMDVDMDIGFDHNTDGDDEVYYEFDDEADVEAEVEAEDEAEDVDYEPSDFDDEVDLFEEVDAEVVADTVEMVNDARECCMDEHPMEFRQLLEDAATPLYRGCSKFTKLSAVVKLYNLKSKYGFSDGGFTELLQLVGEMLPEGHVLPDSLYRVRQSFATLGLGYEKIHCCPSNCILYRKQYLNAEACPKCSTSRWKLDARKKPRKNVPAKVMWYFPPIARFRRMFRNPDTAKQLCWHASTGRDKSPGILRHPADSPQWELFDSKWPHFKRDARNLRLGLSTDGVNPHKHMSSTHSCWPVMTFTYNLPPWMCMKRKFIMLTALISGPRQPGDAIDVFLEPLIDDLQLLWHNGVRVWDAHKREFFTLHAALMWTINDFPAYGNLSGHTVHGHKACPICTDDTTSVQLKESGKTSYWAARRWLDQDHPFRWQSRSFNGQQEFRPAPIIPSGGQILDILSRKVFTNPPKKGECWKRKSIFWSLPYWKFLYVRHNLDVMHIEKNVCEALVGTVLNIPGMTKDGVKARKDFIHMGIRKGLAPGEKQVRGKSYLPPAAYAITAEEKRSVLECLSNIKVPHGYSSNFKNKVSLETLKFKGMKSHDLHVLMQQFFPIAIRSVLQPHVRVAVLRLCAFFNEICKKEIVVSRLEVIQKDLVLTMCLLEQIFPPAFFDIMVHLTLHLTREIRYCGPVHFRWMYPIERYMKVLKGYVRNHTYPEGCIVENYCAEEVVEFCSTYQRGLVSIGHPPGRYEMQCAPDARIGSEMGAATVRRVSRTELLQAHTYILNNTPEMFPYIRAHMTELESNPRNRSKPREWFQQEHNRAFEEWLKIEVPRRIRNREHVDELVVGLYHGPSPDVIAYQAYNINGFIFRTFDRDEERKTQNYGVSVVSQETYYERNKPPVSRQKIFYGRVEQIWDIQYSSLRIPVFKCSWVNNINGVMRDDMGFTMVTFDRIGYKNDSFILASQAGQVFYVRDPSAPNWSVVLTPPQYKVKNSTEDNESGEGESIPNPFLSDSRLLEPHINRNDDDHLCQRPDCEGEWV